MQRIVIDACVLYPTVMREMVLGCAATGAFTPLWSDRLLEEWRLAAGRLGQAGQLQAETEITLVKNSWPGASLPAALDLEQQLWLPDENDRHVLAVAVSGQADAIMTMNIKDFPIKALSTQGISRLHPDTFLLGLFHDQPEKISGVAHGILAQAKRLSGQDWTLRSLFKKARLPRLAKALEAHT